MNSLCSAKLAQLARQQQVAFYQSSLVKCLAVQMCASKVLPNSGINLAPDRGIKKLGYGKYLSLGRYRMRKGLPPSPTAPGSPLTDEPDWHYPDGRPGQLNKAQSRRYLRDQEFAESMVEFNKQFEAIEKMRREK